MSIKARGDVGAENLDEIVPIQAVSFVDSISILVEEGRHSYPGICLCAESYIIPVLVAVVHK